EVGRRRTASLSSPRPITSGSATRLQPRTRREQDAMLAQQATLTADQKAQFDTFGYLVIPDFLAPGALAAYTAAFMDVYRCEWRQEEFGPRFAIQRPGASGVRHQIVPFFARDERFLPLLDHPGLNDVIEQLLGEDCLLMTPGEGFVAA